VTWEDGRDAFVRAVDVTSTQIDVTTGGGSRVEMIVDNGSSQFVEETRGTPKEDAVKSKDVRATTLEKSEEELTEIPQATNSTEGQSLETERR
jgi:hypothetical protein